MSPRAAWRLETLGFAAHDYVAGKADWLAFGLAYQGKAELAGDHLTTAVATCSPEDRLGEVREALAGSRFGMLLALNVQGILLGRLDQGALEAPDDAAVADLMGEGPTTVRPSEEVAALVERMDRAGVDAIVVTRSDGHLLGVFERERGEQAIEETRDADR